MSIKTVLNYPSLHSPFCIAPPCIHLCVQLLDHSWSDVLGKNDRASPQVLMLRRSANPDPNSISLQTVICSYLLCCSPCPVSMNLLPHDFLTRIKRHTFARQKCLIIKYHKDQRYSSTGVSTHDRQEANATACSNLMDVLQVG